MSLKYLHFSWVWTHLQSDPGSATEFREGLFGNRPAAVSSTAEACKSVLTWAEPLKN